MRVLTPHLIADKRVLVRIDMDVPLGEVKDEAGHTHRVVTEDFRLRAALPTLYLCVQYASKVIVLGHIGRPEGKVEKDLSVEPIVNWLDQEFPNFDFPEDRLIVLENLRFENGEDEADLNYAKELAKMGDFFVNEAFAAHHKAASTTVLPTLLPHAAGFHFDHEVRMLRHVREHARQPFVAIIGGAKIEDKLPVVEVLSKIANAVLVGGKLPQEIKDKGLKLPDNVIVASMSEDGQDLSHQDLAQFGQALIGAKQVIWSGPMGHYEAGFISGTQKLAKLVLDAGADSVIGGGDTISALASVGMLDEFSFVSTGGGAMLKFLVDGTLPTIEALSMR